MSLDSCTLATGGATHLWLGCVKLGIAQLQPWLLSNHSSLCWCPSIDTKYSNDRRVKKDCELILKDICMEQGYKIHAIEIGAVLCSLVLGIPPKHFPIKSRSISERRQLE